MRLVLNNDITTSCNVTEINRQSDIGSENILYIIMFRCSGDYDVTSFSNIYKTVRNDITSAIVDGNAELISGIGRINSLDDYIYESPDGTITRGANLQIAVYAPEAKTEQEVE